ncbi:hypothetical protein [Erythrobacter sp.]|uniref:hypothetical protein n=1 Tax=Erythrobacter sp. TaxID=1042 RepID=UPI001B24D0C5|nr:hypothetical protein [Erythrobacter sp.]MBO6526435.1 hypothetical protein [Erythrobacter sp.]MBO6530294.1 hypothetical protein [Erythrobacter sp.]
MKDLKKENQRLWKALYDLTHDALILREVVEGVLCPSRLYGGLAIDHVHEVLGVS